MIKTKLNLFSELILSKFENCESSIQLSDCDNFISIKGVTDSKNLISITDCVNEFNSKYQDLNIKNTIDMIEYRDSVPKRDRYLIHFDSYPELVEDFYFSTSDFPFGFSNNQGKLLYFYFKMIVEKLPPDYFYKKLSFDIKLSERNEIDFEVFKDFYEDSKIQSVIKDCFDLNIKGIESHLKKMDLENYILNPNTKLFEDFVVEDFIII